MSARWGVCLMVAAAGCAELANFDADGTCGNGILEPDSGEDCDTFGLGDGTACGAPDTTRACRFVGGDDDDARCPTGWQAGLDRICRAPSGVFDAPVALGRVSGDLGIGDLDGDGRQDLVFSRNTEIEIAFGDAAGRFGTDLSLVAEAPNTDDFVGDVDGDGIDDIVRSVTGGSLVLRGARRGPPVPVTIPIRSLPGRSDSLRMVEVFAQPDSLRTMVLGLVGSGVPGGQASPEFTYDVEIFGSPQPGDVEGPRLDALLDTLQAGPLATRLPVADLGPAAGGPPGVSEVALLFERSRTIPIVRVTCEPGDRPGSLDCTAELVGDPLTLPGSGDMGPRVGRDGGQFIDYDGDGDLDLVVNTTLQRGMPGSPPQVVRELSVFPWEAGAFGAPDPDPSPNNPVNCRACPDDADRVFEILDVDGDGDLDYLTARGLYATTSSRAPPELVARAPTPWNDARFVALNRDAELDIVGFRPDGVDMLVRTADGLYNEFTADVVGAPDDVEVGDFDGDTHPDLAVVEDDRRVVVLFSDGTIPSRRVVMAENDGVDDLQAFRQGAGDDLDGKDDLVFSYEVETPEGEDARQVALLVGNSSRRMVAGLLPEARAQSYAAGRFRGPNQPPELLLGRWDNRADRWGFSLVPGEQLARQSPVGRDDVEVELGPGCEIPVQTGLFFRGVGGAPEVRFAVRDRGGGGELEPTALHRFVVGRAAGRPRFECDASTLAGPGGDRLLTEARAVEIVDVSGDGGPEALAGFAEPRGNELMGMMSDARVEQAALVVWPDLADSGALPEPTLLVQPAFSGNLVTLNTDLDARLELVVQIADGLHRLEAPGDIVTVDPAARLAALPRDAEEVTALKRIDADGDGLDDLLVTTEDEVFLLRQLHCTVELEDRDICQRVAP